MKKIGLFYFSGTGNTEFVTKQLEKEFIGSGSDVEVFKVEEILKSSDAADFRKFDIIGLGTPVYAFHVPGIMFDLVKIMPDMQDKKVFIFIVPADPIFLNDSADYKLKKMLISKKMDVFYQVMLPMPANFLVRYDDNLSKQLCNAVERKAARIVSEILSLKRSERNPGFLSRLCTFIGKIEEYGIKQMPKSFNVKESCTSCGLCVKICPRFNLSLENGQPKFGNRCLLCMRCLYSCPANALSVGKYDFIKLKGGYRLSEILDNKDLKGDFVTDRTKGFYRHFQKYLLSD